MKALAGFEDWSKACEQDDGTMFEALLCPRRTKDGFTGIRVDEQAELLLGRSDSGG